ncbi:uncharacterized protein C2orf42 homolog isoform X2 [Pithys albifrons albifrons]|uniref:uncharacterized protein C2orf42 homolog isoform X2 n=1 Tax=Pithys albifrons albifrons TaxID=3385563 RepID=UPI003A5CBA92
MDPPPARPKGPSFLSDLGKATLRGIRRCPHCGTYNGTRGLSCKNKTCGTVFRPGARRPPGADAVRVLTGSPAQVYSVRHRGHDSRCFVELGLSDTAIETPGGTLITQLSSGRCHAPACGSAAAEGEDKQCQHMKLALGCQAEATPLPLKSSVLGSVQAPPEAKQSLWELATEPTGPLVQRVTKSVLVVKCKASQRHSLGYLHTCFAQHRFSCSCRAPRGGHGKEEEEEEEEEAPPPRCIHFLACICAFTSDESLAQEFAEFLTSDAGGLKGTVVPQLVRGPGSTAQPRGAAAARARKRKKDVGPGTQVTSTLLAPDLPHPGPRRSSPRKPPVASSSLKRHSCNQVLDESQVSLSFQDWLASVTERIHQTMHYQFEGHPEPLVFHIPQAFFDALQQRISSGSSKKRLPNSTTGTRCPWAPSPSTPGTSPTSCRSSRSSTRPRTATAPTSPSGPPAWRWRRWERPLGPPRNSPPCGPWSSRPSSKSDTRPPRRRSPPHSPSSGSPTSCPALASGSCASSSSTATTGGPGLQPPPGPHLPRPPRWNCPPSVPSPSPKPPETSPGGGTAWDWHLHRHIEAPPPNKPPLKGCSEPPLGGRERGGVPGKTPRMERRKGGTQGIERYPGSPWDGGRPQDG